MLMKLYIYLETCLSSRFMSIVLRPGMTHLMPKLSQNACCGWGDWCHWVLRDFFSLVDSLLIGRLLKESRGAIFLPPSDLCVRSFLYLFYTLIKLSYTKVLSNQASSLAPDWISLLWRSRILASFMAQQQHFKFFSPQLFLWSNSHIHTWLLEKPYICLDRTLLAK